MKKMNCLAAALALASAALSHAALSHAAEAPVLLRQQATISSDAAVKLMAYAIAQAKQKGVSTCIAIDDANGNLLAFTRIGDAQPGCVEAAMGKARSAAANGVNTQVFYDLAKDHNVALGFIPGILPAVAGVVMHRGTAVIGSVGIAGGPTDDAEKAFAAELAATMAAWLQ